MSKNSVSLASYRFISKYNQYLNKLNNHPDVIIKNKRQGFDLHVTKLAYDVGAQLSIANLERYDKDFDKIYHEAKFALKVFNEDMACNAEARRLKQEDVDPMSASYDFSYTLSDCHYHNIPVNMKFYDYFQTKHLNKIKDVN